jgi:hypothetical protein
VPVVRVGRRHRGHEVRQAGGLDAERVRGAVVLLGGALTVVLADDQRVDAEDEEGAGHHHHHEDPAGCRPAYRGDDAGSRHRMPTPQQLAGEVPRRRGEPAAEQQAHGHREQGRREDGEGSFEVAGEQYDDRSEREDSDGDLDDARRAAGVPGGDRPEHGVDRLPDRAPRRREDDGQHGQRRAEHGEHEPARHLDGHRHREGRLGDESHHERGRQHTEGHAAEGQRNELREEVRRRAPSAAPSQSSQSELGPAVIGGRDQHHPEDDCHQNQ